MSAVIEARDLVKVYGDLRAVDRVSLDVRKATIFSLLGPNGAGKTTTVEILEGLRPTTGGSARIFETDIATDYTKIRGRIGVLPQDFEPFDRLTPLESILYWSRLFRKTLTKSDARALLEAVGLTARANVQALRLSGGEKRKLGIAMSLVGEPELLFLDEPTTGLDPKGRRDLWGLIEGIRREGRTVVLTTHYLDEAERLADDVGIMHKGRIVSRGSPEAIVAAHGGHTTIVLGGAGEEGLREVQRRGFAAELEDGDVLVRVSDPTEMRAVLATLSSIQIRLEDMYTRRGTLEDAFLRLVGAKMQEGVLQT
ncbi:MAG: ABC transporter ATP-binding protein [Methanobacteriota archaeon]